MRLMTSSVVPQAQWLGRPLRTKNEPLGSGGIWWDLVGSGGIWWVEIPPNFMVRYGEFTQNMWIIVDP